GGIAQRVLEHVEDRGGLAIDLPGGRVLSKPIVWNIERLFVSLRCHLLIAAIIIALVAELRNKPIEPGVIFTRIFLIVTKERVHAQRRGIGRKAFIHEGLARFIRGEHSIKPLMSCLVRNDARKRKRIGTITRYHNK